MQARLICFNFLLLSFINKQNRLLTDRKLSAIIKKTNLVGVLDGDTFGSAEQ